MSFDFNRSNIFEYEDLEELFYSTKEEESANSLAALTVEKMYSSKVNEKNIDSFIEHFKGNEKS